MKPYYQETGRMAVGVEMGARYCQQMVYRLAQDAFDFGATA